MQYVSKFIYIKKNKLCTGILIGDMINSINEILLKLHIFFVVEQEIKKFFNFFYLCKLHLYPQLYAVFMRIDHQYGCIPDGNCHISDTTEFTHAHTHPALKWNNGNPEQVQHNKCFHVLWQSRAQRPRVFFFFVEWKKIALTVRFQTRSHNVTQDSCFRYYVLRQFDIFPFFLFRSGVLKYLNISSQQLTGRRTAEW